MVKVLIGDEHVVLKVGDHIQALTVKDVRFLVEQLTTAASTVELRLMSEYGSDHDIWIPAAGGTETPFISRSGKVLLYCWNPKQKRHAYLDVETDMVLTDEEARAAIQI